VSFTKRSCSRALITIPCVGSGVSNDSVPMVLDDVLKSIMGVGMAMDLQAES
jgi:hypothetical protein